MKSSNTLLLVMISTLIVGCGASETESPTTSTTTAASTTPSSSSTGSVTLSASASTVAVGGTVQFTASGGSGSYNFIDLSGIGSINSSSGLYTAPSSTGSASSEMAVIEVQDLYNTTSGVAYSTLTITSSSSSTGTTGTSTTLTVTPSTSSITEGNTVVFTVSGGTAPYYYDLVSGSGSLSVSGESTLTSTVYTSSASDNGTIEVAVTDSSATQQTAYGSVVVSPSSSTTTCSSTAPVPLLYAFYSDTKSITSYVSPYGGVCSYGSQPDTDDTVTCTGLTNLPALSAVYFTCSGSMKMYDVEINGADPFGGYEDGLPNGECGLMYTSQSVDLTEAITELMIDARSGNEVVIYGIPSCD